MQKVRWGICGAGNIAAHFVKTLHKIGGRAEAIASTSAERAVRFAGAHGLAKHYGSYEELARDGEIDAVYVATHHPDHAACAELFLSHGKAVLVEKPAAINLEQFARMERAAKEHGQLLMEAMWTRFLPAVQRCVELTESGAAGRLIHADIRFAVRFTDPQSRAFNSRLAGGALLDLGVYTLNMARMLLGDFSEAVSVEHTIRQGVDETECVAVKNAVGQTAALLNSIAFEGGVECTVYGDAGSIKLPVFNGAEQLVLERNGKREVMRFPHEATGFEYEIRHFESLLTEGKTESGVMPLAETRKVLEIMDGLRKNWGLKFSPHEK